MAKTGKSDDDESLFGLSERESIRKDANKKKELLKLIEELGAEIKTKNDSGGIPRPRN